MESASPASANRIVGDWVLDHKIGRGSFAVVWKARHRATGQVVAIKEIATDKLNQKLKQSLECEISILKRVEHRNIVRLFDTREVRAILQDTHAGPINERSIPNPVPIAEARVSTCISNLLSNGTCK